MHDTIALEHRGKPAICVVSTVFTVEAKTQATMLGCPDARLIIIEHPLSTLTADEIDARAEDATRQIEALFVTAGRG